MPSPHDDPDDRWYGLDVCPSCIQDEADRTDAVLAAAAAVDRERFDPGPVVPAGR